MSNRFELKILVILLILFSVFVRLIKLDFPITYLEAKESVTAYSILKTGKDTNGEEPALVFATDNKFIPSIPVFIKVPFIHFFGLNDYGVRIPSVLALVPLLISLFLLLKKFKLNTFSSGVLTLIFSFMPFVFFSSVFNISFTLGLAFVILSFLFAVDNKKVAFLICSLMGVLSSFITVPFILFFAAFFFWQKDKQRFTPFAVALGFIFLIFLLYPGLLKSVIGESTLINALPSNYSYQIERRLSIGYVNDSLLSTEQFNFNRITFNKYFFFLNQFLKSIIIPFNFELLSSPLQGSIVLGFQNLYDNALPKLFFWEIPLIFIGMVLFFRGLEKALKLYLVSGVVAMGLFGYLAVFFLIPIFLIIYAKVFEKLLPIIKNSITNKALTFIAGLLIIFSLVSFYDFFFFHNLHWFNKKDLYQSYIWDYVLENDLANKNIYLTDRLNESYFYYLYYEKIDPRFAQQNTKKGGVLDNGIKRVDQIGRVHSGSFKYYEAPRAKDQIWIGLPGEFAGISKEFEKITEVPDGVIDKKIKGIDQEDKFLGNQLWFIRTVYE